ncbi:MAG TPA: ATP-binding protein [Leptospiraceae bacterium]|nr:ATP-binding protein [Leptospiraceae bacterium]
MTYSEPIELEGEWGFFRNRFLPPTEDAAADRTMTVPGVWPSHGEPGTGFATYRLKVLLPPGLRRPALFFAHTETAYSIYADGRLLGSAGTPGETEATTTPEWRPRVFEIPSDSSEVVLVIHLANFHHARGGIGYGAYIGSMEHITLMRERELGRDAFLVGILLVLALYHGIIFFLRRKDPAPAYFALLCLNLAARAAFTGSTPILLGLDSIPYNVHARIVYLSFYLAAPAFAAYIAAIYSDTILIWSQRATVAIALLFAFSVLFLTPLHFTRFIDYYYIVVGLASVFLLFGIARGLFKKVQGVGPVGLGLLLMVAAYANDVLYNKNIINTALLSPYGIIVFMFVQAVGLSKRFSRAFALSESLSENLTRTNAELVSWKNRLEERVAERTREIETARSIAENSSQAKAEFLAHMSHEIRTPMNGIMGMLRLLDDAKLGEDEQRYLSTIRASSETLLTILNDILDISKIESGAMTLTDEPVVIKDLITSLTAMTEPAAQRKGLQLLVIFPLNMPQAILTDRTRVYQILLNLLSNAVKFTDSGTITLKVDRDNGMIRFQVKDTGIGIPPDKFGLLFQSFTQLDSSPARRVGGTGLGLAISLQLAHLMGGEITAESIPGGGSSFILILPERPTTVDTTRVDTPAAPSDLLPEGLQVLAAEDNEINRIVFQKIGERLRMTVDTAEDGLTAVDMSLLKRYDIIFMDIEMPGLDGVGALKKIQEKLGESAPPIVAVTANAMAGVREKLLTAGFKAYISKPYSPEDIVDAVLAVIRPSSVQKS